MWLLFFFLFSCFFLWSVFIEPNLLSITERFWHLKNEHVHLNDLKIVHISDLHISSRIPKRFLKKISRKINQIKPDIILFSGDFLCRSSLSKSEFNKLHFFLNSFENKKNCFCVPGNHDYEYYPIKNDKKKIVDVSFKKKASLSTTYLILKSIFKKQTHNYIPSEKVKSLKIHPKLKQLVEESSFTFLENTSITLPLGLNIVGLGDITLGQCSPKQAFSSYNSSYPGIILTHNPDSFEFLDDYPGEWIFAGHTHGQQIFLPWPSLARNFSKKLTGIKNTDFVRGFHLYGKNKKNCFINRGLSGFKRIRFNSRPEVCVITCKKL